MALPTQVTAQTATSNATGISAAANLTAIANRWACGVVLSSPQSYNGFPNLTWSASCDNVNFIPVQPAAQRGNWFSFDTPAQYVTVQWSNNNPSGTGTMTILLVGQSD